VKFGVKVNGIREYQRYLDRLPEIAQQAARLAINDVTRKGYAEARKKIAGDVNLPTSYLDGDSGGKPRLYISKFAKDNDLNASITGRQRATSLARFDAKQLYAPSKSGGRKKAGVSVRVKNQRKKMPAAFLIKLRRGTADDGNVGLAIRVPAGQKINNKNIQGRPLGGNGNRTDDVYLLYGPSVQQVFGRVSEEMIPTLDRDLNVEFRRQFARLSGGR
jgi:hypothetical protein